ncbi:hypothetical protein ACJX0J_039733, partial [Zea mays]
NGVHSLCPAVWSKYRRWSMLEMAEECLLQAKDLSGLLLLYSSLGDAEGIEKLASLAKEHGKNNVAFLCLFMLGKVEDCIQLLVDSNRIPEAALLARSYLPSKVPEIVAIWRDDLSKINPKAAESLADPSEYPNLFEDWQVALTVEKSVASQMYTVMFHLSSISCTYVQDGAIGSSTKWDAKVQSISDNPYAIMLLSNVLWKIPDRAVSHDTSPLTIYATSSISYCERCTYWLTAMTDPILFERGGLPAPG